MALPTEQQMEHIIDIPREINPAIHDVCCIYKVPPYLKTLKKEEAYTPQLISIGPFHHARPELKPMHKQKQLYFLSFWERVTNKKAFEEYKKFLKENIKMIKHYYFDLDDNNDDNFVDMILLDSVFILELFWRKSIESEREKDYMFTTSWIFKSIQRDLLLLENQLPIFVLEHLHKMVYIKDNINGVTFLELAFDYFKDYYPQRSLKKGQSSYEDMIKNCKSCKHFTDLVRYLYLPKKVQAKKFTTNRCVLKTATKLNEAGISFEKAHKRNLLEVKCKEERSLLEVKYKEVPILNWFLCLGCLPCCKFVECQLQIPQLKVLQTTECVLRNLIALEQCHYSNQPFICNYVFMIDSLINTPEDVELLVDKEIIVHELGSHKELAIMMNGLCKNVAVTCNYYEEESNKLHDHYHNYWKYYMGMLRSVYFRDPWRLSSTLVGVAIFLFALFNFLRIANLYHPKY